jgi:MoxR-like ATPase
LWFTSISPATQLLARVDERIVGLRREAEVLAASLASGCHVVLEGPPGTGKSTLLRAVADGAGLGVEFVEGNAELTPGRLVGHHDPALVLEAGYTPDTFVDGPLISALREGRLLYIEELNRVPEETLNVLVGALAEGEIHVPRLGRVPARASFRLIAAMNPFDAVGTARVSQAISDRMCRIAIGYQDEAGERAIVERVAGVASALTAPAVRLTRLTREHAQVRMGASVRGAIDLVRLGRELSGLRDEREPQPGDATFADAAIAALSGRLRLEEGSDTTPEAIVLELIERLIPKPDSEPQAPPKGKAEGLLRAERAVP